MKYTKLSMASQLKNELYWTKFCWGVYEQNSIVSSVREDYLTNERSLLVMYFFALPD